MEQLSAEARRLSAGQVLPAPGRFGQLSGDASSDAEDLLAHISCTALGAGCWLPVPADWSLPTHVPRNYVAMLCVGGGADYRIGDKTHSPRAGGLLLCPPNMARAGRQHANDRFQLYSVHFHAFLYGVLDLAVIYSLPVAVRPQPELHDRMVHAAQRIITELGRAKQGHVLAANAACTELFALIWRAAGGAGTWSDAKTADLRRLTPVFRLIESRYAEPLTLRQLAELMRLGSTYFSAHFKKVVGVSPMRYLARYRLDRARELLLTTDLPVAAVAQRTGFADQAYLSRVFRAAEGMPPGEYRRTQKSPMVP